MTVCAQCTLQSCATGEKGELPAACPMRDKPRYDEWLKEYTEGDYRDFYIASSELEAIGYGKWSRLRETIEFCETMGYRKVGLAFCRGLRWEAKVVDGLLRKHGLTPVSVICKTGGVPKEAAGIRKEMKLDPDGFEAMCNPIAQARLLNEQHTEFNIALGLCVGHDALFYKHSDALVTTLVAKDRVLAHNPAGAIYCAEGYYRDKL